MNEEMIKVREEAKSVKGVVSYGAITMKNSEAYLEESKMEIFIAMDGGFEKDKEEVEIFL